MNNLQFVTWGDREFHTLMLFRLINNTNSLLDDFLPDPNKMWVSIFGIPPSTLTYSIRRSVFELNVGVVSSSILILEPKKLNHPGSLQAQRQTTLPPCRNGPGEHRFTPSIHELQ